jgi:hypothetical protein
LWHADWKAAFQRDGVLGLCAEALSSLSGANSYPFFVPLASGWSGQSIQRLLAQKGVKMWGWAFASSQLLFHVRISQAAWAQYVMLRAGVPLQGPMLARAPDMSTTTSLTAKHPPQGSTTSPHDPTYDFEQQFNGLIQKVSSFLDL